MSKDPSPKADGLRAMREAKYKASEEAKIQFGDPVGAATKVLRSPKKLIPYAGKAPGGRDDLIGNKNPTPTEKPARKRKKLKRKIA